MRLFILPVVLAMGDPNFIPSNPVPSNLKSGADPMLDSTRTLNQIDQTNSHQLQQEDKYNQNEEQLEYRLDDAFKEVTSPDKEEI